MGPSGTLQVVYILDLNPRRALPITVTTTDTPISCPHAEGLGLPLQVTAVPARPGVCVAGGPRGSLGSLSPSCSVQMGDVRPRNAELASSEQPREGLSCSHGSSV